VQRLFRAEENFRKAEEERKKARKDLQENLPAIQRWFAQVLEQSPDLRQWVSREILSRCPELYTALKLAASAAAATAAAPIPAAPVAPSSSSAAALAPAASGAATSRWRPGSRGSWADDSDNEGSAASAAAAGGAAAVALGPVVHPLGQEESGVTTVHIRGLTDRHTNGKLVEELQKLGFGGLFDFVYVPRSFNDRKQSHTYAFVNFLSSQDASRFAELINYRTGSAAAASSSSSKAAATSKWVVSPAKRQGLQANVSAYRQKHGCQPKDAAMGALVFSAEHPWGTQVGTASSPPAARSAPAAAEGRGPQ